MNTSKSTLRDAANMIFGVVAILKVEHDQETQGILERLAEAAYALDDLYAGEVGAELAQRRTGT